MLLSVVFPILLLLFGCFGIGATALYIFRRYLPPMPIWLYSVTAYFLGQGVLGSIFIFLGLGGFFFREVLLIILIPSASAAIWHFHFNSNELSACIRGAFQAWRKASIVWQGIFLLHLLLLCYGITTLGGWVEGDAIAFYLAWPKVTAATHRLLPLPGYESFSTVGALAEVLLAALFSFGMPNISPRIFSWINFFPTLLVLYGLCRQCKLSRRGSILAVIMASTSSAAVVLWGSGKTDLFAVGPAFAACVFALIAWDRSHRPAALLITGIFAGLASVFKISYLVTLLPALTLIITWVAFFEASHAMRLQNWSKLWNLSRLFLKDLSIVAAGFIVAFAPHAIKNLFLLDSIIGNHQQGSWYASATTLRIVLSYPFALTFGRYWAQFGTLSPLILAFAPLLFCLPRPTKWRDSKLAALGIATIAGVLLWVTLMPSILSPRYFLATLLMCGVPIAAAGDAVSRGRGLLALSIPLAVAATLVATPFHANGRFFTFDAKRTSAYPLGEDDDCLLSSPSNSYCFAHKAINAAAGPEDRVLLMTYYRYWLRPELLQSASTQEELGFMLQSTEGFWTRFRQKSFHYILYDANIFGVFNAIFESPPDEVKLHQLYRAGTLFAYKVTYKKE